MHFWTSIFLGEWGAGAKYKVPGTKTSMAAMRNPVADSKSKNQNI